MMKHFYTKYIMAGITMGLTMTVLVVYASVTEESIESAPLAETVLDSNPEPDVVNTVDLLLSEEVDVSTSTEAVETTLDVPVDVADISIASTSSSSEMISVAADTLAEFAADAETDAAIVNDVSIVPVENTPSSDVATTAIEQVVEILNDSYDELRIPRDPRECLDGGWREFFAHPGECMRAVREGIIPY